MMIGTQNSERIREVLNEINFDKFTQLDKEINAKIAAILKRFFKTCPDTLVYIHFVDCLIGVKSSQRRHKSTR